MGDVEYRPDHRGTARLMQTSAMRGACRLACYDAIPFAQSISPDAPPLREGYIDSFVVDSPRKLVKIAGTRRVSARLINTADHATVVETGRGYNMGHHVLGRTADWIERG